LLYIGLNFEIGELWPMMSPWGAKIVKGVKKIVMLFS